MPLTLLTSSTCLSGAEWVSVVLTVDVVDHLMGGAAVVLQHVVVLGACSEGEFLCDGKEFGKVLVRNVVKLGAMILGDN